MTTAWGIIGIGAHADTWMAPAIVASHHGQLAAVCSRDLGRAQAFAAKHGAAAAYDRLEAMLADPAVEIVYVGSPDGLHAEHTLACAAAGKHVLCDKPMATTVEDCQAMIDGCRRAGVLLAVGYNQRYQPAHETLRGIVQSGETGPIVLIKGQLGLVSPRPKVWWNDPAAARFGSLASAGSHMLDLIRWITGQEVVEVTAMSDATPEHPIEELVVATLRLSGGSYALLDSSRRMPLPANDLVIHAEKMRLATRGTILFGIGGAIEATLAGGGRDYAFKPNGRSDTLFVREVDSLSEIVRTGGSPRATGEDGLAGVRTILAIQTAARDGRRAAA